MAHQFLSGLNVLTAAEENVFAEAGVVGAAGEVGFAESIAAQAVPVELAAGLLDALAVAAVGLFTTGCFSRFTFGRARRNVT